MKVFYVKNMVCDRCILVVKQLLDAMDIPFKAVGLGEIELARDLEAEQEEEVKGKLAGLGFEWLDNRKFIVVERIKSAVIAYIHHGKNDGEESLSTYIQNTIDKDYSSLSSLFTITQGITIEQYAIQQRIEKAKELLLYDELNLNEISWNLGYSSVQHLSSQFKKLTGLTPTQFKKLKNNLRLPLDKVGTQPEAP
ncbi:helix-turn-helix domain-containing protein [Flavobacterium kingsejongi]|uniref:HTH araC/xylS-type domain-containing protein n=1 Tax=Flavobacterium kingsejongi TaxID=1678728 RepID=A0A2S1LKB8_9FLAO|nr:AraC family transcriptional regulator [Flavobacterium kingsejongi]AWG24168.1 hypothetical protein FK004_02490 [Flavobacterium kingsejongi]